MTERDDLVYGWTIYYRPPEFPHHYAVQLWLMGPQGEVVMESCAVVCDTLEEAREQIPAGALCFDREPEDPEMVVETWI